MKRKSVLLGISFIILSIVFPLTTSLAKPKWFIEYQCEIIDFEWTGIHSSGCWLYQSTFVGVVGGPNIVDGTVEGVDCGMHDGVTAYMDVYLTITDKDGDQIVFNDVGLCTTKNPGQAVFDNVECTVIEATGKFSDLVGQAFYKEGSLTDFSDDPAGGYIHGKLYLSNN